MLYPHSAENFSTIQNVLEQHGSRIVLPRDYPIPKIFEKNIKAIFNTDEAKLQIIKDTLVVTIDFLKLPYLFDMEEAEVDSFNGNGIPPATSFIDPAHFRRVRRRDMLKNRQDIDPNIKDLSYDFIMNQNKFRANVHSLFLMRFSDLAYYTKDSPMGTVINQRVSSIVEKLNSAHRNVNFEKQQEILLYFGDNDKEKSYDEMSDDEKKLFLEEIDDQILDILHMISIAGGTLPLVDSYPIS